MDVKTLMDGVRKMQWEIIQKENPKWEGTTSTWIDSPKDAKTFYEASHMDNDFPFEEDYTEDWTVEDKILAEKTGQVMVYSSKPIKDGGFVTPSLEYARSYAGKNGPVYSQKMDIRDIAWIDIGEGQVVHLPEKLKNKISLATKAMMDERSTAYAV